MAFKSTPKSKFVTLECGLIHRGRVFDLKTVRIRAPDGHEFKHDIIFHPGAAVIVPVLKGERLVLVKQFRTATGRMILEFPAGTLEKGESPLACAKREILEETGYEAKRWRKLVSFYPAPGVSTELMHVYFASDLMKREMALDRDEFIRLRIIPFRQFEKMIQSGTVVDAKTMIGYFYYRLHRKNVSSAG